MKNRLFHFLILIAGIASLAGRATAQGFNIDLDDPGSPPPLGGGTPSDQFSGAQEAYQKGYWDGPGALDTPVRLRGLDGNLTAVVMTMNGSGGGLGVRFEGNQGEMAALLNDGTQVGTLTTWRFDGIQNGLFDVVTYAVFPDRFANRTAVSVTGALGESTQYVTGPMPGNKLILGQTHVVHRIEVRGGSFTISVARGESHSGFVNGFQIVPVVPEPTAIASFGIGLLTLCAGRRKLRR